MTRTPLLLATWLFALAVSWVGCARGTGSGDDDDDASSSSSGTGASSTGSGSGGSASGSGGTGGTASGSGGSTSGSGGSTSGSGGSASGAGGTGGTGSGTGGAGGGICGLGTLPFFEDFEGTIPPPGWKQVDEGNVSSTWSTSSNAYSGTVSMFHTYDLISTDDDYLVLPAINLSNCAPGTTITLSFYEVNMWSNVYDGHYVAYSTQANPTSASQFTQIVELGIGSETYSQRTVSLDALAGQPLVRLAFRYYGWDADDWYIDDVQVEAY